MAPEMLSYQGVKQEAYLTTAFRNFSGNTTDTLVVIFVVDIGIVIMLLSISIAIRNKILKSTRNQGKW